MLKALELRALLAAAPALTDTHADAVCGPRDAEELSCSCAASRPLRRCVRLAELRATKRSCCRSLQRLTESRCECQVLNVARFRSVPVALLCWTPTVSTPCSRAACRT
jgi:hypothetical protein